MRMTSSKMLKKKQNSPTLHALWHHLSPIQFLPRYNLNQILSA